MLDSTISMRKIIRYISIIIIVVFCINSFFSLKRLKNSQVDTFISYPKIADTYSHIFSEKAFKIIKPSYTFYNKQKNPIATYKVLGDKYQLIVYRMSNVLNLPINQILQINWHGDQDISNKFTYDISLKTTYIQFGDANVKPGAIDRLYLDIDAEIIDEPFYTDSTVSFSLKLKNLKARHEAKGDVMFFVNKKKSFFQKQAPVDILFLKKNKDIYLLLMSLKNAKELPKTKNFINKLLIDPI